MWLVLIDCLESNNLHIKNKLSFLNTLINVQGLDLVVDTDISLVKTKIKEFCADASKRTEGLLLLYAVVHCSSTVFIDNWSQIVLGSMKCPDSVIPREIPLKVLNRMLVNFGSESHYNDVFSKLISDILPIILNPEDNEIYKLSCQSLAVCMKYVPEIAGTRVADIEKLLLKELDNPYGEIAEVIGDCFAALPMCILHVQKAGSSNYKDIWCNIFTKLMNTMHSLLNDLMRLSKGDEDYVDVSNSPVFDLSFSETNEYLHILQIDVFKSLCQCIAKMLSSESHLVRLPVTDLLKTLFRVFGIERIVKSQKEDGTIRCLKLAFSQMLNGVYVVLEALILNFHIIEQSNNFVAIVNMSLYAMEEIFLQSSVSQVRGSTWKLINVWLKQYGSRASSEISTNENLIKKILADVSIEETENVKSKQLKSSDIKEKNQNANKSFTCFHALKVLKSLVETSSCYMKKTSLDTICSTLLRSAKIVLQQVLQKKQIPFPYSDDKCRKMLFDAFFMYAIYSDPLHSKCIVEAQSILSAGSKDTSAKVGRLCHRFRKLSRYYLNPRKPPPEGIQFSLPSMLKNNVQQPVMDHLKVEWGSEVDWTNANGPLIDDQMEVGEVAQVQGGNSYKVDNESELIPMEQTEETDNHMNHEYRRLEKHSSQSVGDEESIDDSDIEPTYVSTDSNPPKISLNDSPRVNSFAMQSCVDQFTDETRTERLVTEEVVPNLANNAENNVEEQVSAFVEVKSAGQKNPQSPMGNGEWRNRENAMESEEELSDIEEEGDEEGEANEENSDNAGDETSDGKRSPEYDEERPSKRRRRIDEDMDMLEEGEDEEEEEDIPVNNQSSDEESEVKNEAVLKPKAEAKNLIDKENQGDIKDTDCKSPTLREMCGDFVLAEPAAPDTS